MSSQRPLFKNTDELHRYVAQLTDTEAWEHLELVTAWYHAQNKDVGALTADDVDALVAEILNLDGGDERNAAITDNALGLVGKLVFPQTPRFLTRVLCACGVAFRAITGDAEMICPGCKHNCASGFFNACIRLPTQVALTPESHAGVHVVPAELRGDK